jgi:hypothetical protein
VATRRVYAMKKFMDEFEAQLGDKAVRSAWEIEVARKLDYEIG